MALIINSDIIYYNDSRNQQPRVVCIYIVICDASVINACLPSCSFLLHQCIRRTIEVRTLRRSTRIRRDKYIRVSIFGHHNHTGRSGCCTWLDRRSLPHCRSFRLHTGHLERSPHHAAFKYLLMWKTLVKCYNLANLGVCPNIE